MRVDHFRFLQDANGFENLKQALYEGMDPDSLLSGNWPLIFHMMFAKDVRCFEILVQAGCKLDVRTPTRTTDRNGDSLYMNLHEYFIHEKDCVEFSNIPVIEKILKKAYGVIDHD